MDAMTFPQDPERRRQLEEELARAALALLEYTGASGACVRLPPEDPSEEPAWVLAGSAAAISGLAPGSPAGRDSLDPG